MSEWNMTEYIIGCGFVLILLSVYAWFEVIRQWRRHFVRKATSNNVQSTTLIGWLLLLALAIFVTGAFFWIFYPFWILWK